MGTTPGDCNGAGANDLLDADWPENIDDGLDFRGRAGYFDRIAAWADIDDLAAEYIDDAQHLGPGAGFSVDPDQDHLAFDEFTIIDIDDLDYIDQFVQLLGDLLDDRVVALGYQGQAGDLGINGFGNAQTFDIESAATEQASDPGKHSGFILEQHR